MTELKEISELLPLEHSVANTIIEKIWPQGEDFDVEKIVGKIKALESGAEFKNFIEIDEITRQAFDNTNAETKHGGVYVKYMDREKVSSLNENEWKDFEQNARKAFVDNLTLELNDKAEMEPVINEVIDRVKALEERSSVIPEDATAARDYNDSEIERYSAILRGADDIDRNRDGKISIGEVIYWLDDAIPAIDLPDLSDKSGMDASKGL